VLNSSEDRYVVCKERVRDDMVAMSAAEGPSPATVQLPGPADAIDWSHATPQRFRVVDNELAVGIEKCVGS
jgi:hypothetical protein